jgi:hypothetical protein
MEFALLRWVEQAAEQQRRRAVQAIAINDREAAACALRQAGTLQQSALTDYLTGFLAALPEPEPPPHAPVTETAQLPVGFAHWKPGWRTKFSHLIKTLAKKR